VLKLVASGLHQSCREYDYVARMGGDEFVLVLAGLDPEDLPEKRARIEAVVREAGVAVCAEPLISISAGAAFYPEDGKDAEGLLAEADRRMYTAKQRAKHPGRESRSETLAALSAAVASADAPSKTKA
jgi:diguanylate cyclase (GGDEF)-like protein